MNALPLAMLLVHPGGAAGARDFVARALELWLREKSRARMTHALARCVRQAAVALYFRLKIASNAVSVSSTVRRVEKLTTVPFGFGGFPCRRWKIECEAQRFRERGLGYRTRFGALKIKARNPGENRL